MPQASRSPGTESPQPAHATMDTERLRALTEAVIAVGAGLELGDVLQRLVVTAATFSGARYGALGITGETGRIVRFVTYGVSAEVRDRLGGIPSSHGIPRLLLLPDAEPMRLSEISDHPRSVGFPRHHPPMRTFLGVPVRVSGKIFGNLYVADKQAATGAPALFTAEDEEALLALGAAAGVAVENARLYAAASRRQRWSDAVGLAIHAIIARSDRDARARLAPVPGIARVAGQCELAAVAFCQADGRWQVRYADVADRDGATPCSAPDGSGPGDPGGRDPSIGAVIGSVLPETVARRVTPAAVVELGTEDLTWLPGSWAYGLLISVESGRGVPEEVILLALRDQPDPSLGRPDRSSELEFGQRLGLAVQVAQAHADSAALRLLRDRDRIARDLHDHVIQRLFAIGLSLQAAGVVARVPEVQARLSRAVDDIDETIKDVRRTIFELHAAATSNSLRRRVDAVLDEVGELLPADVDAHVEGGLDDVPADLAADLTAVLREALTNVARHARATSVRVYVTVGAALELEVVDDGVGLPEPTLPGEGLPNLAERATSRGGTFQLSRGPEGGTALRWSVPLA